MSLWRSVLIASICTLASAVAIGCGDDPTAMPVLEALILTPQGATTTPGTPVQFATSGRFSDQSLQTVPVTYSVSPGSGATITASAVFTAASPGVFTVTASANGLSVSTTITVMTTPLPPPPPPPPTNYTTVIANDWQSYNTSSDLRASDLFWWYRTEDVYDYVHVVSDATFGKVVRITFKGDPQTGWAPKIDADFPAPVAKMWFRWRIKWAPGWTTQGTYPTGYANSWKMAFWLWDSAYGQRGEIEFSNTTEYILGLSFLLPSGNKLTYTETPLAGSQNWANVTTEWSDSEWWEYVVYYDRLSSTNARQHFWRRRLTANGVIANNPFTYLGLALSNASAPLPAVRGVSFGPTRNKNSDSTMYLFWGPWEVVDGSLYPNPWGMPNL
jgi:hypothetical protein